MKFVSCFIIGLLLLCISTLSLVSCLPILSTTALLDDYAFRFYFSISLFGFGCGWYFLAIAWLFEDDEEQDNVIHKE